MNNSIRLARSTLVTALALAASAAILAACSSSSGSSSNSTTPAGATTTSAPASSSSGGGGGAATGGAITTATGPLGSYLADSTGKAIYILTSDKPGGASACTTGCLKFWPPVAAPSPLPSGLSGITATFGTFTAADGSSELTVNGYPVYTFTKDTGPGTTNGQGVASFGGTWWLVNPSGSFITTAAPAASSASPAAAKSSANAYGY